MSIIRKYKISLITDNSLSKEDESTIEILNSYFCNLRCKNKKKTNVLV